MKLFDIFVHSFSTLAVTVSLVAPCTSAEAQVPSKVGKEVPEKLSVAFEASTDIGTFTGYYRGTQLQGNGLKGRMGLMEIARYLFETSFPYIKRPYPEEIPFVDTISMVRFLGGWSPKWRWGEASDDIKKGDLAYVDEHGEVKYRWELVAPRLDPYLEMGYKDIIISLDNVPYDLAAYESQGEYGQIAPPRDYNEWETFIEGLCRHLVALYGFDLPNSWTFRMGTENNNATRGSSHTFDGNHDQWIKLYDHSAAAVKRILPGAKFGPGEFSGGVTPTGPEPPKVNYVKLAEHCVSGVNTATGKIGAPFDFLANSSHSIPRWRGGRLVGAINPNNRIASNLRSYANILNGCEKLKNIPIYIFQLGILQSELQYKGEYISTNEPGARGAAWAFHVIIGMKAKEPRMAGIWHWSAGESVLNRKTGQYEYLLDGKGWLFSILDHCCSGDAYVLKVPDSPDGTTYTMFFVAREDSYYLVTSAFNVDRDTNPTKEMTVTIPQKYMHLDGTPDIGCVLLTDENSVHRAIKDDLAAAGLLRPAFAKFDPLLASVFQMGGNPGRNFVAGNIEKYKKHIINSLTLKPFNGEFTKTTNAYKASFSVQPDSIMVITFNHKPRLRRRTMPNNRQQ